MNVKELKEYLEALDENLEVCVLKNGGHGCGDMPHSIKPTVKEVETYYDGKKKMLVITP